MAMIKTKDQVLILPSQFINNDRAWLPAPICFHADLSLKLFLFLHNTVAIKRLSGKITPKTNLTLSPEFDGRAGEPAWGQG